jgi:allantoinase
MAKAVAIHRELTGAAPLGWYTGRDSPEHGNWSLNTAASSTTATTTATTCRSGPRSAPPMAACCRIWSCPTRWMPTTCASPPRRASTPRTHFFDYLRDSFDVLYAEGRRHPAMLSIGMHCRLLGRPGRFIALQRFLDHIEQFDRVWVCRRIDVARHWATRHPWQAR